MHKVCNWQNALTLSIEKPSSWSIDFHNDSLYYMFDLRVCHRENHFMVLSIPSELFLCQLIFGCYSFFLVFCLFFFLFILSTNLMTIAITLVQTLSICNESEEYFQSIQLNFEININSTTIAHNRYYIIRRK